MVRSLVVLEAGPSVTVQDLGRPGLAHLGVPRSGALDAPAAALARRLVGDDAGSAVLEVLLGGLLLRPDHATWVAVTGAPGPVHVDDRAVAADQPVRLPAGSTLRVGYAVGGLRRYVAVAGGVAVAPVLGSRSTDTLSGTGPPAVRAGDRLPVGSTSGPPAPVDVPLPRAAGPLRLHPGPRVDHLGGRGLAALRGTRWTVGADSDRVGLRLEGSPVERRAGEVASEGVVLGAVQLPPSGLPVVFLADHPVTGGYPVVAVVDPADLWRCAQAAPGDVLVLG